MRLLLRCVVCVHRVPPATHVRCEMRVRSHAVAPPRARACVCVHLCFCLFFFMHMCEIDRGSCSVSCRITSISQKLTGDNEKEGDMAARSRYTHSASRAEPPTVLENFVCCTVCECTRAITIRRLRIRPRDARCCD